MNKLVAPSFFNSNPDVRLVAIEVSLAMYKIVGGEVRQMIQEIDGLKPNIMQTITKRMAQLDKGEGGGGGKYITGSIMDPNRSGMELEQIPEAHDEDGEANRKSVMRLSNPSPEVQLRTSKDSKGNPLGGGGGSQASLMNPSGSQEKLGS